MDAVIILLLIIAIAVAAIFAIDLLVNGNCRTVDVHEPEPEVKPEPVHPYYKVITMLCVDEAVNAYICNHKKLPTKIVAGYMRASEMGRLVSSAIKNDKHGLMMPFGFLPIEIDLEDDGYSWEVH